MPGDFIRGMAQKIRNIELLPKIVSGIFLDRIQPEFRLDLVLPVLNGAVNRVRVAA